MKKFASITVALIIIVMSLCVFPACKPTDERLGDYYMYATYCGGPNYSIESQFGAQKLSLKENGKFSTTVATYNDNTGDYDYTTIDGTYRFGEKGYLGKAPAQKVYVDCDYTNEFFGSEKEFIYANGGLYFNVGADAGIALKKETSGILPFSFLKAPEYYYESDNHLNSYRYEDDAYTLYRVSNIATSMKIPADKDGYPIVGIDDYAFSNCLDLTSVEIPDSVTRIGNGAFYNCRKLTEAIIPEGVTSIGNAAFAGCESLESIVIPSTVTEIGQGAFANCSNLKSIVIPEGVEVIRYGTFGHCTSLESVSLPQSLRCIEGLAFDSCVKIDNLVLPSGLRSIKYMAFAYAFTDINEVNPYNSLVIPKSVTEIRSMAFYNAGIYGLFCEAESRPEGWSEGWDLINQSVRWAEDWEYVDGVPTVKAAKKNV